MPRPDPRFRRAHARRCSPSRNRGRHAPPVQMHQCGTAQHPCAQRSVNRPRPLAQTQTPPRAPEPMIAAQPPIRNFPSLHREQVRMSMPADVQRHESLQAPQAQSPARPSCPPHRDRWLVHRRWSAIHGTIHADHAQCQSDRSTTGAAPHPRVLLQECPPRPRHGYFPTADRSNPDGAHR